MTIEQKAKQIAELEAQIKAIKAVLDPLKAAVVEEMTGMNLLKLEFEFGKVTRVQTEKLQVVDERKVITELKKLKLDKEYVEPQLKDIFNVKAFVAERGMVDGVAVSTSEYHKITPAQDNE